MQVECKYQKMVPISQIIEHPRNMNNHPEKQVKILAKIIQYQGWRHPLIVSNRTGYLVVGHGRLAAAKLLGLDEVPVDFQDFESEAQEMAFLIADNKVDKLAKHDDSMMIDEIKMLGIDDFELLGLDDFNLPIEPNPAKEEIEDEVPTDVETRCKPGDLWILGNHRLLCGDSTNVQHVERLMGGEKADMVFTDPPYGMKLDADFSKMGNTGLKHKNVIGDHDDFTPELIHTIFASFPDARELFCWGADYYSEHLPEKNSGSWVVWDKRSKGEDGVGITDGQFGSDFELCWSRTKHKRILARVLRPTGYYAARTDDKAVHPTQKPIALAEFFFENWGKPNDRVADLYGGSGSTLIACEKTGRKCYMAEIDPFYCDIIIARWEKYSGKEARLEQNGQTED